ncbi:hypothetical protein PsorP6_016846 [Peronosclerospora sorghi]|uniref:Uncharacterized protein n=1 Tax=Peronosclerospora sorghi TaxID=230839 RepID=A0ACC0WFS9_9STRA|nr:hypothetical protein PsorP6_016846 [Peronosclerospora sorghi]
MGVTEKQEVVASEQQLVTSIASTALSVVAAVFLGGGFYYGMTKRKKVLTEEEKTIGENYSSKNEFKPKRATFFERKLALDKPLPPSTAAWKALLGVTVVSVTGCCMLVAGAAAALNVTNMTDLRERLHKTPPSRTKAVSTQFAFNNLKDVNKDIRNIIKDEVNEELAKSARD